MTDAPKHIWISADILPDLAVKLENADEIEYVLADPHQNLMRAAHNLCGDLYRSGVADSFDAERALWGLCKDFDPTEK